MSVCTQFHHLFFGHPLGRLNLRIVVKYLTSLLLSILLTWPIQFNRLILTNESMSGSPDSCVNSLLYPFLQFLFTSSLYYLMMFIHSIVLWQVHSLFQSQFSTECDLVLPLSIFSILSFPDGHSISPYVFFLVFLSFLSFLLYYLQ